MQLMTQADYARHRGVTPPAVTGWKKAELIVFAEGPTGKPMVDVVRTDMRINAKVDPMRGRPSVGIAPPEGELGLPLGEAPAGPPAAQVNGTSLASERQEHVREQRIGAALKNAAMAGDLVPLAEAEKRISEVGRAARERMHAWLRSQAERFAAERDPRTIMAIGEEGIDRVFGELADVAKAGGFAGEEDEDLSAEEEAEMEAVAAEEPEAA